MDNPSTSNSTPRLRGISPTREILSHLRRNPTAMIGMGIILVLLLFAILASVISPYDPDSVNLSSSLLSPSAKHIFGTDKLGRDVLSRVIYGARISLLVGFVSQFVTLVLGMFIGSVSGYFGGKTDTIFMRLAEIMLAIPDILLAIVILAVFGPGIFKVIIALSIVGWAGKARLIRGQVLQTKNEDYVTAARVAGASNFRIIVTHVLPNCLAPVVVSVTLGIAGAIMAEATLSFLGLGVQPPTPSWGNMIFQATQFIDTASWLIIFPGIAIALAVFGFNLFGDGLNEAMDPRLRKLYQ